MAVERVSREQNKVDQKVRMRSKFCYSRSFVGLVLALISRIASADDIDEQYKRAESAFEEKMRCEQPVHRCWKPAADLLAALPAPETARQREVLGGNYWLAAKVAMMVGDFEDAGKLFDRTLSITRRMDTTKEPVSRLVELDTVALELSMRRFDAALTRLNGLMPLFSQDGSPDQFFPNWLEIYRAAALIGLSRNAEADAILRPLLSRLDYDGVAPWEGRLPFGPPDADPYDIARRIAWHFTHEGKFDTAVQVLHMLQGRQAGILARQTPAPPGGYWAMKIGPAQLLLDEASIELKRGDKAHAAEVLKKVAPIVESNPRLVDDQARARYANLSARCGQSAPIKGASHGASAGADWNAPEYTNPLGSVLGAVDDQ